MRIEAELSAAENFTLTQAICLYESARSAFPTVHPVEKRGKKLALGPGVLLTREALNSLLRKVGNLPKRRQVQPANVLSYDGSRLAWYVPSARRPIFFQTRDAAFNKACNAREVLHPALLFVADPGSLYVYALPDDERPENDTPVFIAPYMNLYQDGHMCQGNHRLPNSPALSEIGKWERAFFETTFTHSNLHGAKLTPRRGGHNALWLYCRKAKSFRKEWLAPFNQTVEQVINR